jgi:hypothetical protein
MHAVAPTSIKRLALLVVVAMLLARAAAAQEEAVLRSEPEVVTLRGFIVNKRFYGPPNHGEEPHSDRKVQNWLLILNEPITIRFAAEEDGAYEVATGVRRMTLSPDKKGVEKALTRYLGQEVTVTGTLITPFNRSFHWASVRMDVQSVSLLPRSAGRPDEDLGTWHYEEATR